MKLSDLKKIIRHVEGNIGLDIDAEILIHDLNADETLNIDFQDAVVQRKTEINFDEVTGEFVTESDVEPSVILSLNLEVID